MDTRFMLANLEVALTASGVPQRMHRWLKEVAFGLPKHLDASLLSSVATVHTVSAARSAAYLRLIADGFVNRYTGFWPVNEVIVVYGAPWHWWDRVFADMQDAVTRFSRISAQYDASPAWQELVERERSAIFALLSPEDRQAFVAGELTVADIYELRPDLFVPVHPLAWWLQ